MPKIKQGLIAFIYFLLIGTASSYILKKDISLELLMQIFTILLIFIGIITKFVLPKIKKPVKNYIIPLALLPIVLLIYLLILSTGILFSPFLILSHFFAIGVAFLISPQISVSFILSTFILFVVHLIFENSLFQFLSNNSFLAIIYTISYLGLIPFSYILAKEYKIKEEWLAILENQIATSQIEEEQLLKNIQEAVILINNNFDILYTNQTAQNLFKLGANVINQNFYKVFNLKDKGGRNLFAYSLPFDQTFKSKLPQIVKDIQISGKDQKFIKIDLKIIPAITSQGPLGLVLVISDKTSKYLHDEKEQSTATAALTRFLFFLDKQKKVLGEINQKSTNSLDIQSLLKHNEELSHLAQDFIYTLRLESGEIGALSSLFDLGKTLEIVYLNQLNRAKEKGLNLVVLPQEKKALPLQPRENLKIKVEKSIFPEVFVLGNESWVIDSLTRLLELCYLTSQTESTISISLSREGGLAKINIYCAKPTILAKESPYLFEKFYATLNLPSLRQASGLEGYIANNLLSRMGANIEIQNAKDSPEFSYIITFGANEITSPPH